MSLQSKQELRKFIRDGVDKFGTMRDLRGMLAMVALTKFSEPEAIKHLNPSDPDEFYKLSDKVSKIYYYLRRMNRRKHHPYHSYHK